MLRCYCKELDNMPNEMVEKLTGSIVMVDSHIYYEVAYTMNTKCLIVDELISLFILLGFTPITFYYQVLHYQVHAPTPPKSTSG